MAVRAVTPEVAAVVMEAVVDPAARLAEAVV
jgi:hypothetical protein